MKIYRVLLAIAGLGFTLWSAAATTMVSAPEHIRAVQLIRPNNGWLLTDSALLWTDSDGERWQEITPPAVDGRAILSVQFVANGDGWVAISTPSVLGPVTVAMAITHDQGATWTISQLPVTGDAEVAGASIDFIDARHGWVALRLATTMNTSMGRLFRTNDGGSSWIELPKPPSGEAVHFTSNLDGTIVGQPHLGETLATTDAGMTWHIAFVAAPETAALATGPNKEHIEARSFADELNGWLLTAYGDCPTGKRSCHQDQRLYSTHDAGLSFRDVTPFERHPARAGGFAPRADSVSGGGVQTSSNLGFDACQAPAISDMQTWWYDSPYYDVNAYYGGGTTDQRTCKSQNNLKDSGWGTLVTAQGWSIIPTWAGRQASCADRTFAYLIGATGDSLSEGQTEATAAADAAANFGFAGTIAYYDLESYSVSNATCQAKVQSFVRGWVRGLHARGMKAGVYIQSKNAHLDLEPLWGTTDAPDALWIVNMINPKPPAWTIVPTTQLGSFSDTTWTGATRIRQFWIDTMSAPNFESYGGVRLEIDNDQENGPVVNSVGAKFAIGDAVTSPSGTSIRSSPTSGVIGGVIGNTGTSSNPGTILAASIPALLNGVPYNWWQIRWRDSTIGWSAEALLAPAGPATININATKDGVAWQGTVGLDLTGPQTGVNTAVVPYVTSGPGGTYTLQYLNGGPSGSAFTNITPLSSQTVLSGDTITFTVNFSTTICSAGFGVFASCGTQTLTVAKAGAGSGTVTSSPAGINCGSTCQYAFTANSLVTLTASAASGSVFSSWSGACGGTSTQCTVTMSQAFNVTANFTLQGGGAPGAFNKISPANGATGQSTSPVLSWSGSSNVSSYEYCLDTTNDNACSGWTSSSTPVSGLSSGATYYWQVRANNGSGTTYADGSSTAYWSFTTQGATSYTLSIGGGGTGQGTVTGSGINCTISGGSTSGTCNAGYPSGTTVSLTATPAGGSTFGGWFGEGCGGVGGCHVTMSQARSVTATFSNGGGGGTPHAFIDVPGVAVQVHDLAVGTDGSVYVLFPTGSPKTLAVVKSTDGGVSWDSPVSVPNSAFSNFEYHLVVDSGGTLHVVWWLSSGSGTETYYSRSTNGGSSFSSPIRVRSGNSYSGYRTNNATEPVVAADGLGSVYVAYSAYTLDGLGSFVGYNVWVSKSTDGGNSFQPEFPINTITSSQKTPVRIRATASNFYVLYMDQTNYDLYFYRRNAGGASGNTGRVNTNVGTVQYDGDFVGASDEMTFYAAYSDTTGDYEGNINFCRSTDGGITWPACTRVNDNANRQQNSPRLGLDNLGGLHLTWADGRANGRYQIYYSYSSDSGSTFSSNVDLSLPVTGTDFTQPHVVVDNPNSAVYVSATRNYSQVVVARLSMTPPPPPPPATPTGLTANVITSTRVDVSWNAVAGATYLIYRQGAGGGFVQVGTPASNSFSDTTVSTDSAYLYRVRAVNGAGQSPDSAAKLATTVIFVDSPLASGIGVKAVHLSQLRTAVNAVRLLAGLPAASFTDPATSGTSIKALHVTELRAALDTALGALSLSTSGYTDTSLSGVTVKAVHFQELRNRVN